MKLDVKDLTVKAVLSLLAMIVLLYACNEMASTWRYLVYVLAIIAGIAGAVHVALLEAELRKRRKSRGERD